MTEAAGPLAEVDPDALSAVFAADPLTLSDQQVEALVTELRRRRNAFLAKEAAKASEPKAKRMKSATLSAEEAVKQDLPPDEFTLDLEE